MTDRSEDKGYVTKTIQRDRLAAAIYQAVAQQYPHAVSMHYNEEVTNVQWQPNGMRGNTISGEASRPRTRAVPEKPDVFCYGQPVRTAPREHQPPTAANRHQPPIAKRQPPLTDTKRQPPATTNRRQPPPIADHQPPTANF